LCCRKDSLAIQAIVSFVCFVYLWFTSPTVDLAEAKLQWSEQEHLARQPATLALPTADRHRSQPLAGIEKDGPRRHPARRPFHR
jgi:hypothetical protein